MCRGDADWLPGSLGVPPAGQSPASAADSFRLKDGEP